MLPPSLSLRLCLNGGYDENGSKSSAETVEKNVDIGKGEATGSPVKEQMKKDVKESSSEDEEKMEDSPVMGLLTELKKTKVQTKISQVVEKKKIPTESTIKEAVKKRASYLKANSDKITMAGVRLLLAEDLELDKDTLYPFKKFISQQVDEVLKSPKFSEPASGVKKKNTAKNSHSNASKKLSGEESSDSLNSESEIEEVKSTKKNVSKRKIRKSEEPRKRKRPAKETKESSKKRIKLAETSEENGEAGGCASEDDQSHSSAEKPVKMQKKEVATPAYGKRVEHLKSVIKSCGMSVPPAVYKRVKQVSENKREAFLIKELEEILSKEGMSTDPSEKVRKRKDRAKELEGIDMSNIVSSTRRRSTTSFVATPKPKIPVESDGNKAEVTETSNSEGDSDNDNDDDDDDTEDGDDSQSEEFNEVGSAFSGKKLTPVVGPLHSENPYKMLEYNIRWFSVGPNVGFILGDDDDDSE
ncbi:KNR4/SMI1 homolog isoform X2 [Actinidia eriantha]|uniref:KNR4/SMI1 homolog isoform X2 n=1 Tax=Actinidia eriantha TaxID=165200 RepID=UPI002588B031|nr:KNR4/SMI1 homolog isoform X2 [Actinidia eriantha]